MGTDPELPQRLTADSLQTEAVAPLLQWRLVCAPCVWTAAPLDEAAAFFSGPGETMVLTPLGAVAVEGIAAGCTDVVGLEAWCRQRGFAEASEDLHEGLHFLIGKLAELEIIERVS